MRPLIGITTYLTRATFGAWEEESALVPADYVRAVERAGGRALLVPPSDDGVDETLDALDGIVFSGGSDLDPATYGQERHAGDGRDRRGARPRRARAAAGRARARHARARDLPRLAAAERRARRRPRPAPARGGRGREAQAAARASSPSTTSRSSRRRKLGELLGEHAPVKSHHHQGFGRLGEGLRESARAEDGTIEALEDPSRRFTLGVLWHPEAGEDLRLFEALVREARDYRAAR